MSEPNAAKKTSNQGTDYENAEAQLLASILRGDSNVANRATLGPKISIHLFQALRLIGMGTSLEDMVGGGSRALVYRSGQRLGEVLGRAVMPQADKDVKKYLSLIHDVSHKLAIGVLVPEKIDLAEGHLVVRLDECVSCAGIGGATAPICHFEAGMVGGLVRVFTGTDARAVETRCNAVGDKTCGVEVQFGG